MSEEIKEDLPNRQNLVETAVSFLLNPSVRLRPDDAKLAFLKKKGLTDFEIAEAFSRVKNHVETSVTSDENNQLVNAYPLPPYQTPSTWFLLRSYGSTFIGFAVALYLLHRFYKLYIEPRLFGSKSEESEISALEERLVELNNNISQLNCSVASLEEVVKDKMQEIDRFSMYAPESVPRAIKDVKDEIGNVKSLLLNRFSFPGAPKLPIMAGTTEDKKQNEDSKAPPKVVTIPKWQLPNSEPEKSKVVADGKMEEIEGKDKSPSEPSSLESSYKSVEDKIEIEDSKIDSDDNTRSAESRIHDEDSKTILENHVKNTEKKTQNESSKSELLDTFKSRDSDFIKETNGIEDNDSLSDPELIDQTNVSHR